MRRWIPPAAIVVLAVPATVLVLHRNGDATQATHYLSARVSRQTVADRIDATGRVAPAHLLSLAFSTGSGGGSGGGGSGGTVSVASGQQVVRTVSVHAGQQVRSGQVLAQLDDSQQQQQLTVAQAQLAAAQARAAEPVPTVPPAPGRAGGGTGQDGSTSTVTTRAQNAAAVAQAEAEVANAQAAVDATRLVAPADGVVTAVNVGTGLPPTAGQAAVEERSTAMLVQASVSELDVPNIRGGQTVQVTFPALSVTTAGAVASAPTQANEAPGNAAAAATTAVTFPVQITIPHPPTGLLPGMSAGVSITVAERQNVLAVPTSAIGGGADNPTVQVLLAGRPSDRQVTVGLSTNGLTEIVTGLREGETVVTGVVNPARTTPVPAVGGMGINDAAMRMRC